MDRKNGYTNNTIPYIYFSMHILFVEAPEFAKRAKFWANWGKKYKIFNFEGNLPFGTL